MPANWDANKNSNLIPVASTIDSNIVAIIFFESHEPMALAKP